MDSGSIDKALERIEAALARIENAAARQKTDSEELRSRHETLKTAASRSLGQLDELIAGQRK
jgi:hypothetical protein